MHETRITHATQDIGGAVGGVVVDNNDVKIEIRSLAESTLHGIQNCPVAILDWNHDAGATSKYIARSWHRFEFRLEPCPCAFQIVRDYAFHFDLVITIFGINIVELPLSRWTEVRRRCRIEWLGNSNDRILLGNA